MDVQYQLRMSGEGATMGTSFTDRVPHTITPKETISTPVSRVTESTVSHQSQTADVWVLPTPLVQNEILKHEVRQSKVSINCTRAYNTLGCDKI